MKNSPYPATKIVQTDKLSVAYISSVLLFEAENVRLQ